MKKILSVCLVCALVVCTLFTLVSCFGLSGAYRNPTLMTTYEFSGSKVTITVDVPFTDNDKVLEGKYEITEDEDGDKTITFTFEGEDGIEGYDAPMAYSEGEEDGEKFIKLNGIKYTKVD